MDAPKFDAPETVEVNTTTVACDGNGPLLGHPRVYLSLEGLDHIDCPYCDRRYVLKPGSGTRSGH